jgi:hypothetical protein
VGALFAGELQSSEPVGRHGRLMASVPHDPERQLEIVGLVLHHEDLGHAPSPRSGLMRGER